MVWHDGMEGIKRTRWTDENGWVFAEPGAPPNARKWPYKRVLVTIAALLVLWVGIVYL